MIQNEHIMIERNAMKHNKILMHVAIALFALSAAIYAAQILIFRDPRTTAFYIFQDFAFLPASIAIATVAVGAILDEHDRQRALASTRMLRSQFFTGVGAPMLMQIEYCAKCGTNLGQLTAIDGPMDTLRQRRRVQREIEARQKQIEGIDLRVNLTQSAYDGIREILEHNRLDLLILGSTHNLNEAERFAEMLWGIFHLMDEYRLRGAWENLSPADIAHLEADFAQVLRLMLANSVANNFYLRTTYPNFYGAAQAKFQAHRADGREDDA
ncbi:MAG: hypothetical protein ACOX1H_01370 [Pseudoramibacter sp.]